MFPLSAGIYSRQTSPTGPEGELGGSAPQTRRVFPFSLASSSTMSWIALFLLSLLTSDTGVSGRAVNRRGFPPQWSEMADGSSGAALRTDAHRERCAELAAPWLENRQAAVDNGTVLQLRVRPFSPGVSRGLVFPEKSLFNFVRGVYRCCQEGLNCRSVKGIQGRLRGDTNVEFLLTQEILSLTIRRAELHLQLSNPQHLDIHPALPSMAKRSLPTRYSVRSRDNAVELRVDLLFLLQSLQEAAGGARGRHSLVNMRGVLFSSKGNNPPRERPTAGALQDTASNVLGELGLIVGCSQGGVGMACETSGVHLLHTPFMALYYP